MDTEQDPDKPGKFPEFLPRVLSCSTLHALHSRAWTGRRNDNLLFDDHAEKKSLTLTELGDVLRSFNSDVHNDRVPAAIEMITLHSCSMSAMEVAYELKGAANYLLASQGPTYVGNLAIQTDPDSRLQ